MRIVIHGPPPWASAGYPVQLGFAAKALKAQGHQVAISAYAGVHQEREWDGIPVMGTGGKSYGNGVIAGNYYRWQADLLILFTDPWVIEPGQLNGLTVMPYMPLDTDPLGVMDIRWLEQVARIAIVHPVAMSRHGATMLDAAGWPDVPVVPHVADPVFRPDLEAGQAWRASLGIPADAFVITKVGVNDSDDRKAWAVTLQAFAAFAASYPRARLYAHCEPQVPKAPNLAYMAVQLGLRGQLAFADEYRRGADLYSTGDMAAIYCGSDVTDATSKGEGFGVPVIESLACGTPVIGCRNSAMTEKISPTWGWLITGQREWAPHHHSWWVTPSVADLTRAYAKAIAGAHLMRNAAAREGERWLPDAMAAAWKTVLDGIEPS